MCSALDLLGLGASLGMSSMVFGDQAPVVFLERVLIGTLVVCRGTLPGSGVVIRGYVGSMGINGN